VRQARLVVNLCMLQLLCLLCCDIQTITTMLSCCCTLQARHLVPGKTSGQPLHAVAAFMLCCGSTTITTVLLLLMLLHLAGTGPCARQD
jgi:hypothetical protein